MNEIREAPGLGDLGRELVTAAVLRGDFLLRSGARSSYYIDKYLFTTQPGLLRRLAVELASRLPSDVQRVAGTVLGAVPLATAVSLETGLPMVIVRVEKPKEYGTSKQIEGALSDRDCVVLIEDVVTTGGASLAAVDVLREVGADVLGVVAVVDREQGGAAAFAARGIAFQALFTKSELGL